VYVARDWGAAPPPPGIFVGAINKGLTGATFVSVPGKGLKVACFETVSEWRVRVANKRLTLAALGAH